MRVAVLFLWVIQVSGIPTAWTVFTAVECPDYKFVGKAMKLCWQKCIQIFPQKFVQLLPWFLDLF
jgi:hypothetical protein